MTPTVLVPGMLCDADLWSDLPELPGEVVHAEITEPTIGGMAEQVLSSVDGEFSLVGLSLGAIVGFEVLRRAPERVRAFGALSTNAGAPRPEQLAAWERQAAGDFDEVVAEIGPAMFAEPSSPLRERFLGMAKRIGPEVFRDQLAAQATRVAAYDAVAAYPGPVRVLCGDRDALCPTGFHEDIVNRAARGRLHVLSGAGHLLPLERPAVVGALIRRLLERGEA
ncbi:alpha/beta fold hydrolase [Saccharopolyspora flava]|uniref:Alpha/beta hydrolase family protein n=1 Tax=Saccharopolyspora flava TaxID=95161 RepID=A0A1I6S337_9PSEU|nr:alpha/beta hydrolase [Saccharopolyspora flava]SFS71383.1 Alpha/beta hydrolase family protein [Saccharopolyspora flava]